MPRTRGHKHRAHPTVMNDAVSAGGGWWGHLFLYGGDLSAAAVSDGRGAAALASGGDRGDAEGLAVPDRCLGAAAGSPALHLDPPGRGCGLRDTLGLDQGAVHQAGEGGASAGRLADGLQAQTPGRHGLATSLLGARDPGRSGLQGAHGLHPLQPRQAWPGVKGGGLAVFVLSSLCETGRVGTFSVPTRNDNERGHAAWWCP